MNEREQRKLLPDPTLSDPATMHPHSPLIHATTENVQSTLTHQKRLDDKQPSTTNPDNWTCQQLHVQSQNCKTAPNNQDDIYQTTDRQTDFGKQDERPKADNTAKLQQTIKIIYI